MEHPRPARPDEQIRAISDTLNRYARSLTGCSDRAEDLAQQTIAKLLARSPENILNENYAIRTLTNLWISEQRTVKRRLGLLIRHAARLPRWFTPETDHDTNDQLNRAIDQLPPKQRAVIVLRLIEGLGYEQIAIALETNVQTVRANLHLARKQLRKTLGDSDQ